MARSSRRKTKNRRSSTSPTPSRPIKPAAGRQLQIVRSASTAKPFELPDGWVVEVKPRRHGCYNQSPDKYYYEPHTGRRFRSLVSIKRYLNGEEEPVPLRKASRTDHHEDPMDIEVVRRVVYDGKMWKPDELEMARRGKDTTPTAVQHKLSSMLPDGWIVEDVPRNHGLKSDRYIIEPLTGMKFRSMPEVKKYLTDETVKMENFDGSNPPEKVNWVMSGSGEENWEPFVENSEIPEHVKELWQDTFFLGMTGERQQVPQVFF